MQALLTHLGYPALFFGTLVEGETFILVAGFLAHRGYFHLGLVVLLATLGAFTAISSIFSRGAASDERSSSGAPGRERSFRGSSDGWQNITCCGSSG